MPNTMRRGALVLLACLGLFVAERPAAAEPKLGDALAGTVAALEKRTGGRLGVSVVDTASGAAWSHRGGERFPITSTFKAFACAHLLDLADKGEVDAKQRVRFEARDLEEYSPITKTRTGGEGMSLLELCDAATATSDNSAGNFILAHTGGPAALTGFMRRIGDGTTRLDRTEPALNDVGPGEVRDTTSPDAAAASLRKLMLGDALSEPSRRQLETWLVADKVGGPLLRASLPEGWRIADRTGAGAYGSRSVIAVVWPKTGEAATRGPIVAAVYLTDTTLDLDGRNAVVAEVGAALVKDLAP
ncbi:class A beta-lactamase [Aureimonas leprariae]|uniref:Beta-lactamase n=1 Tax=Plantimonas leprariae TaxID=2615207 RepID=A0A7V7TVJ2_9HYPH|nr:class A beta-lactamase [Aureimonas leprariae]KAB0678525.1 class A beta-lactamase [Aureimonas leprariae]